MNFRIHPPLLATGQLIRAPGPCRGHARHGKRMHRRSAVEAPGAGWSGKMLLRKADWRQRQP